VIPREWEKSAPTLCGESVPLSVWKMDRETGEGGRREGGGGEKKGG
jgi:hypothetical protein